MTVIQPNRGQKLLNWLLAVFGLVLGALLWHGVTLYNDVVDLNHNINLSQNDIKKAELANADFKNKIYGIISPAALEALAQERGLVKDSKPEYFSLDNAGPEVPAIAQN